MLRRALPGRFRVSVHYYLGSAASLVLGAGLGTWLASLDDGPLHGRVLVAHALTNTLGWVGLTLTGTLLTLWPTMLRTRMDERADRWTRRAFPIFAAALLVAVSGALLGWSWLAAGGVGVYLVGLAFWGRGLWGPVRRRRPSEFAPASVAAGIAWLTIAVAWVGWILASTSDWPRIDDAFVWPAATLTIGLLQVLLGASSYLLPSVLGGGPSVVRAGQTWLNRGWLAPRRRTQRLRTPLAATNSGAGEVGRRDPGDLYRRPVRAAHDRRRPRKPPGAQGTRRGPPLTTRVCTSCPEKGLRVA